MKNLARRVAILGGIRTPFVKSFTKYKRVTNQDLLTETLTHLVNQFNLKGERIGDVAVGSVIKHASDWNLTRESVLGCGLDPTTPGYNVQRACGTSLETIWQIALKISAGQIEVGIGGGTDTNSDAPASFKREFSWKMIEASQAKSLIEKIKIFSELRPADLMPEILGVREPRTGLSMGEHCEKMVKEWKISRHDQDEIALESHKKCFKAYETGFYEDLVFEYHGAKRDGIVRGDTSMDKLAKLKPAFDFSGAGTLTAGNSTPLTDGGAVTLLSSEEWAQKMGIPVLAYFIDAQVEAVDFVDGEGLLMAPTIAVSELLKRNNLSLQDFDFYEIHEAFAGQVLCTLKAWESADYCRDRLKRDKPLGSIDRKKMNVNGGSLAVGHPFAATGSRIVSGLAKILSQHERGLGLISICTAGGMGMAAILERD